MMKVLVTCLLVATPLALSAAAPSVDNYAASVLSTGNYGAAVASLEAAANDDRRDESALLNLALAYQHLGRATEAKALYARVLELEDVELNTVAGRSLSAHAVARAGLARPVRVTTR